MRERERDVEVELRPTGFHNSIQLALASHLPPTQHQHNSDRRQNVLFNISTTYIIMPLIVPKRNGRGHAIFPITLSTTIYLVFALCYLQLVYLVSYLLRPLWSSHREFPPLKGAIERLEKVVIDLILGIMPFATYRSPTPSGLLHEDPLGHRINSAVHAYASRVTLDNAPHKPTGFITPPNLPQCYPGGSTERTSSQDQRLETARQSPVDRHESHGSLIYDTIKKHAGTRPKVPTVVEAGPVTTQQFARSSVSLRRIRELEDGTQVPELHPNTPRISQKSPACSMDGAHDVAAILQLPPPMEADAVCAEDEDNLKLDRGTKCRSTESYPGKFPVSDSMEFSSLATASYAFRERGTTSVRPFSDY